jgi:hypothetical protein
LIIQPRAINASDPAAVDMEISRQRPNRRVVIVVNTNG